MAGGILPVFEEHIAFEVARVPDSGFYPNRSREWASDPKPEAGR